MFFEYLTTIITFLGIISFAIFFVKYLDFILGSESILKDDEKIKEPEQDIKNQDISLPDIDFRKIFSNELRRRDGDIDRDERLKEKPWYKGAGRTMGVFRVATIENDSYCLKEQISNFNHLKEEVSKIFKNYDWLENISFTQENHYFISRQYIINNNKINEDVCYEICEIMRKLFLTIHYKWFEENFPKGKITFYKNGNFKTTDLND